MPLDRSCQRLGRSSRLTVVLLRGRSVEGALSGLFALSADRVRCSGAVPARPNPAASRLLPSSILFLNSDPLPCACDEARPAAPGSFRSEAVDGGWWLGSRLRRVEIFGGNTTVGVPVCCCVYVFRASRHEQEIPGVLGIYNRNL